MRLPKERVEKEERRGPRTEPGGMTTERGGGRGGTAKRDTEGTTRKGRRQFVIAKGAPYVQKEDVTVCRMPWRSEGE